MPPDPDNPPFKDNPKSDIAPPTLPVSGPPVLSAPPPLPPEPERKPRPERQFLAVLLSLCLALFLADAVVSLADNSLILLFNIHLLSAIQGILFLLALLMGIAIYGLMGLTPMIPKRLFLPVTLFNPVAGLVLVPVAIYAYGRLQQIAWVICLIQVIVGLNFLRLVRGGFKLGWPLVAETRLVARRFSWLNLSAFLLVNAFVILPAVVVYLFVCAGLAVNHFSDGFVALRSGGLTVQVRKYARGDGKTIQLFPMAHVGDPGFYRKVSQSFPTNSVILMEGVSDERNLLTNKITYKRMATSLGLVEQQKEFKPIQGELVRADVDVAQFAKTTIDFLNLVTRIHAYGLNVANLLELLQYAPPPGFERQLFDDLLKNRNRHLLEEIHSRLSQSDTIIVPWGAAHMPDLAREIQESGFRLDETRDYVVIRFHSIGRRGQR